MIYEKRLIVPKNTSESSPAETTLEVSTGVLRGIEIGFPAGCCGLVHAVIHYWERQIWPSNIDSDFSGDDEIIKFDEDYKLFDQPTAFTLKCWNEDDTFDHTVTLRALVKGEEEDLTSLLKSLVGTPKVASG